MNGKRRNVNLLRVFLCDYMNMEIHRPIYLNACFCNDADTNVVCFANVVTFSTKSLKCIDVEMRVRERKSQSKEMLNRAPEIQRRNAQKKQKLAYRRRNTIFGRSQTLYTKIAKEKGQNSLTCWHIVIESLPRVSVCTDAHAPNLCNAQLHNISLVSVCVNKRRFIHSKASLAPAHPLFPNPECECG